MKTIKIKPGFIAGIPDGPWCSTPDMLCRFFRHQSVGCDLFKADLVRVGRGPTRKPICGAHKNWQCIEAGEAAKDDGRNELGKFSGGKVISTVLRDYLANHELVVRRACPPEELRPEVCYTDISSLDRCSIPCQECWQTAVEKLEERGW